MLPHIPQTKVRIGHVLKLNEPIPIGYTKKSLARKASVGHCFYIQAMAIQDLSVAETTEPYIQVSTPTKFLPSRSHENFTQVILLRAYFQNQIKQF